MGTLSWRGSAGLGVFVFAFLALYDWFALGGLAWGGFEFLLPIAVALFSRTGTWERCVQIFNHHEAGTALALFRIGVGATLLLTLYAAMSTGVHELIWIDDNHGGIFSLRRGNWLGKRLGGPTPNVVAGLSWSLVVCGLSLVLGLGGRVTAFITLNLFMALNSFNTQATGSYDLLIKNSLWLLVLANSTATLSADCRIRHRRWIDHTPVPAWPRYLVIVQLVLMYWSTGVQKVSDHWIPGGDFSALYYIFQQPTWQRMSMEWTAWVYPLTQVGTAVTWFWEVLAPLVLLAFWYRATRTRGGWLRSVFNAWNVRTIFAIIGVVMHVIIFGFMEVGPFSVASLALYPCLWSPDEYRAMFRSRK